MSRVRDFLDAEDNEFPPRDGGNNGSSNSDAGDNDSKDGDDSD